MSYAPGLTRSHLRTAFDLIDSNKDGSLSMDEFVVGCTSMGFLLSNDEITAVFKLIDADGGGDIDFDEFSSFVEQSADESSEFAEFRKRLIAIVCDVCRGALRCAFDIIDANGDGDLQKCEFVSGCKSLGIDLTDEDLDGIFQCIDEDGSGEIDFDEFCNFLQPDSNKNAQLQFGQFRQKLLTAITSEAFNDNYFFRLPEVIIVQHFKGDYIQVDPTNENALSTGGKANTAAAQFQTEIVADGAQSYLQSVANQNYIRITNAGETIDLTAEKSDECLFKIQRVSNGFYKLESIAFAGKYIAVNVGDDMVVGKGGPYSRLHAYRRGIRPPFSNAYVFAIENTVVIEHKFGMHLRVEADSEALSAQGGKGNLAQFVAEPSGGGKVVKFKSTVSGKYITLVEDASAPNGHRVDCSGAGDAASEFKVYTAEGPNQVRLESCAYPKQFLNVTAKGVQAGDASKFALVTIYRQN